MAETSKIEWTDATWNPITGCTLVSEGCRHCYAARLAATRLAHLPSRHGLARLNAAGEAKFTGEVRFNREWLTQPLKWKRPRMIFVCAHGDLFHESVPDDWIDQIFAVMALAPHHTFQVLTKRPERMREYFEHLAADDRVLEGLGRWHAAAAPVLDGVSDEQWELLLSEELPLPNVWLGTSVEDQERADERIPHLLATPAAVRFVSAEPLLGTVDLEHVETEGGFIDALAGYIYSDADAVGNIAVDGETSKLDWVIVGGESGPEARPMHPDWVRALRDQCAAADVSFFFKQWGEWIDADEWYDHLSRSGWQLRKDGQLWQPPQPLTFAQAEWLAGQGGFRFEHHSDGRTLIRVGKKAAGRILDGVEHNGMPQPDRRAAA